MNKEPSMDQAFLAKLKEAVEENLDNEQFGVEELSREVGLSRSQIHRKLQELTGQSTSQFIRQIRLEHAMELLKNEVATVSEIAYRVGFSSPTYFSTCFHKYYGFPPGEAADRQSESRANHSTEKEAVRPDSAGNSKNRAVLYSVITITVFLLLGGYYYFQTDSKENMEPQKSIAVLPLHNLTDNPDQAYYVDGLHDALIGELGQLGQLRVISRTSTLRFKDTQSDIREIAKQLDVNNIIEGSVYKAGDSVRIQVQLIEVNPKEQHIWAESYERDTRDVLSMLSNVTREIAQNVEVTLTSVEDSLLTYRREVNPEAYKAYLRGSYELTRSTPESYQKGISHLLEATRIDPADPLPWARLALGYNTAGHGSAPPPDAFDKAQAAAKRALKLDETLGEVHLALALVDLYQEWDWEAVENNFDKILAYDPNIAEARLHYGWYLILKGASLEEVVAEMRLAMKLDPFRPLYPLHLGFVYWYAGNAEKAIEMADEALSLNPDFAFAHYLIGLVKAEQGNFEESVSAFKDAAALNPNWSYGLTLAEAMAGDKELAREKALEIATNPTPLETWGLAEIYTALGETDQAFKWLDASYEARWSWYPWMYLNPPFEPLKDDPRFEDHLKRINLPQDTQLATTLQ